MKNLREALAVERKRLFVGRESELQWMQNWLDHPQPPTEVLLISGMGGIGKSALLLQFLNMVQGEDTASIWLDGRICSETPAGFIESLHAFRLQSPPGDSAPYTTIQDVVKAVSRQKTLLCIDNYEFIQKIEGWLRGVFLPQLSETGVLIVLAARPNFAFDWRNDLAWGDRVREVQLGPLSRNEALAFCTNTGLDRSIDVDQLMAETQGLPLAMALTVESLQVSNKGFRDSGWPISTRVSAVLLREVAASDLKETLDLLCILPQASPDLLGRLLRTPLSTTSLHQLCQLSFVRPTTGGFALHDVARAHLIEEFLHRDPVGYETLRRRVIEGLVKFLKEAHGPAQKQLASILLSVYQDVFQLNSISIISPESAMLQTDSFRITDMPHLHQIMTEEAEYTISAELDHALLNALAEQFPESIGVFRSKSGVPLAYTAGLLLYKDTVSFLEPFIPGVLRAVFELEFEPIRRLQLEEANTYYHLLTGVILQESDYTFYELVGAIVTDMIMRNSAGLRTVIVTDYDQTNELLKKIGYQSRPLPGLPKEHPMNGASIHELDLRGFQFGDHLLVMLGAASHDGEINTDMELTEEDLKLALPLLGNPTALGQSNLAQKLRCTGPHLHQKLYQILFDAPPFPLDDRKQGLLQLYCNAPLLPAEIAAQRLHISRATYYRLRNQAMNDLRQVLLGLSASQSPIS